MAADSIDIWLTQIIGLADIFGAGNNNCKLSKIEDMYSGRQIELKV